MSVPDMGLSAHNKSIEQVVAHLYISHDVDEASKPTEEFRDEVKEFVKEYLAGNPGTPTGASFIEHEAYWVDEDGNEHDEAGLIIEVWVDTDGELAALADMKVGLEKTFDQFCVCLSTNTRTFLHDMDARVDSDDLEGSASGHNDPEEG